MCYRISNTARASELAIRFNTRFDKDFFLPFFHRSAFARAELPLLTVKSPKEFQLFQWGLIPHWHTNLEKA